MWGHRAEQCADRLCGVGRQRKDWRGSSAKRIRNQLLDRSTRGGPSTRCPWKRWCQQQWKPSSHCFILLLCSLCFVLLLHLSLFLCGISLMHVCSCHRDLALSVTACSTLLIHFMLFWSSSFSCSVCVCLCGLNMLPERHLYTGSPLEKWHQKRAGLL